ncbi:hypothetical protein PCC8801_0282 [Rippkaea orientalis PCC 8801]|uniref:Cytochrome c family protein n=1 Tax=Rippkaea orientalis (strain PCC 8801 / RF-1) TaxID=41431 RepID=B7K362_RIPO1|nr:hypothetical protein [Rippkaea orientalis]ACK64382.1 hypothetical protein PCC8801_0282 [Rippkaea orientalis PCC 8801]
MSLLLSIILTLQLALGLPFEFNSLAPNMIAQTIDELPKDEICLTSNETLDSVRKNLIKTLEITQQKYPNIFNQTQQVELETILGDLKNETIRNEKINLDNLKTLVQPIITQSGNSAKVALQLESLYQIIPTITKFKNIILLGKEAKSRYPCLSYNIPHLIEDHHSKTTVINPKNFTQMDLDFLSWQSFIALNWPADSLGNPLKSEIIGNDLTSPRVWEFYKNVKKVFINPDPQNKDNPFHQLSSTFLDQPTVPKACQGWLNNQVIASIQNRQIKVLSLSVNDQETTQSANILQAIPEVPLIDKDKNYVLYEDVINEDEFNYIRDNKLYDADYQFNIKEIDFPASSETNLGAMEIRAAWRIIPQNMPTNQQKRYYTQNALIYVPAKYTQNNQTICQIQKVGLIGFHIVRRMKYQPQWVWSTFEQVDNAPQQQAISTNLDSEKFSFWQPDCQKDKFGLDCVPNHEPEADYQHFLYCSSSQGATDQVDKNCLFTWSSEPPYASQFQPTQVESINLIQPNKIVLGNNQDWQELLKKIVDQKSCSNSQENCHSVWQYYQLVGTQWRQASPNLTENLYTDFSPIQPFELTNTVMETYRQKASCVKCHATAQTAGLSKKPANFSFLLRSAKSAK